MKIMKRIMTVGVILKILIMIVDGNSKYTMTNIILLNFVPSKLEKFNKIASI